MAKSVFLEVDPSICDKNRLINQHPEDEDFDRLFKEREFPPKAVQPTPGFCVKSRENGGKKIFINFCATSEIPAPKDIDEGALIALWNSDEAVDYRVPMSIGSVRSHQSKPDEEVNVCDIAINDMFMRKVQAQDAFKQFVIAVGFAGYESKFEVSVNDDRIVLKNKKVMGSLQVHYIQQRDVQRIDPSLPKLYPKVTENVSEKSQGMSKIQEMGACDKIVPKFRLVRKQCVEDTLIAEFFMPCVGKGKDITLDVGEDRIVMETSKGKYFVDTFHEFRIDRDKSVAEFDNTSKFLTLKMPILSL